jgi:sugar O-acyltransferase (sialic acid O-acetyltransferase NeuD family)
VKKLYIVSAGDFGREVHEWARAARECGREWEVAGFIDTRPDLLEGSSLPVGIVGSPVSWEVHDDHLFVCAVGDPVQKMRYAGLIRDRGGRFANIVHPTAIVGQGSAIGQGCILCPHVTLTVNVTLGDFVVMNCHSSAGHDAVIGDGTTISGHCDVTGRVRIGKCVFLGSHACVLPEVVVGDYAVIGAGSVALRTVPARTTVFGVPAVAVRGRREDSDEHARVLE